MQKNVASQSVTVLAIDTATNLPKTGDAANITLYYNGDNGGVTVFSTGSGHPSEDDATNAPGCYTISMTQGETNFNRLNITGKSSTSGIRIVPILNIQTVPAAFTIAGGASGGLFIAGTNDHCTITNNLLVSGTTTLTGAFACNGGVTYTSSTGDGFVCSSTGGNGNGQNNTGNGSGVGTLSTGGATGHGRYDVGGATSGNGYYAQAPTNGKGGHFFSAGSGNPGLFTQAGTNADGFRSSGAGTGHGVFGIGGSAVTTSAAGDGFRGIGGTASTGAGGVAGKGFDAIGGSGAATTNGAGDGFLSIGGGTTTVAGGNGMTLTHTGSGKDFNATTTPLTLAKTTNITGFNDIAATAIVSDGTAITTSGGAVVTVTNLTNAPTAGDFTAAMKTSLNAATPAVTVSDKTGFSLTGSYDFAKGTVAMTEAYAANGVAPTPVQALFAIHQMLMDFIISGTSYTVKKLDNTATAFVVTLNDATTPTGASRT